MHKIDTNTATANNEFTDGDSGAALAATELNAAWFNTVQRELCNLVTSAGFALNNLDDSQIVKAVKKLGFQSYYSENGTLNVGTNAGNSVIFCAVRDLTVTGVFESTSIVFVVPIWQGESVERIKFTYRGASSYVYNHCMMMAFISEGVFDDAPEYMTNNIAITTGRRFQIASAKIDELQAGTFKVDDVVYNNPVFTVDDTTKDSWDDSANWAVGQSKFIASDTNSRKLTYYRSDSATQATYFYLGYAKQFICVGTTTNSSGVSKAILICCSYA